MSQPMRVCIVGSGNWYGTMDSLSTDWGSTHRARNCNIVITYAGSWST